MPQKQESKHSQDKSELELKKVEEEKPSSLDANVLTDKQQGSEAVCALDKPASPSETPEVLRVSTKQCIANFFLVPLKVSRL